MQVFLIIMMFLVSVYGVNMIAENGRVIKVGEVTTTSYLTALSSIAIAVITVAYDVVTLYLLVKVV